MKKIAITIFCTLLLFPAFSLAQASKATTATEPATKLEEFLAKKGKLIVKEFYDLGEVTGRYGSKIELKALVIYEPGQDSQKEMGLKIQVTEGGKYEKSSTSFLDLEEVESLSKAIGYMANLSTKWKDINRKYTEIIFSTRGDFQIGFYQKESKQASFSSAGYIGKTRCFFASMNDLNSVKLLTDKGIEILKGK